MKQFREFATGAAVALLALLVVFTVLLVVVSNTDWGREQVRRVAVRGLNDAIAGEARIGRVEGNLLRRIHLVDVTIVDEEGVPLVVAGRIAGRPALLSLLRRRVVLREAFLEDAHVLLDRPPDEEWNFVRIFIDPDADPDRPPARWGRWIEFREVTLVRSHLTIRSAWSPPDDLSPAELERFMRRARAPEARTNIVEVPGGFQNVMYFGDLDARLSRLVIAHPRVEGIPVDIERFSGIVQPFKPPAAFVRDLAGSFLLRNDTLYFNDVDAVMPDSRLTGDGMYILDDGDLVLRLQGAPVALNDLRWLHPPLPTEGSGSLRFLLDQRVDGTRILADEIDLVVRDATIQGRLDMITGDTLRFRETDLTFARVDTRLLDDVIPGWRAPRHGLLTGDLMLDGIGRALQVDADVTFDDFAAPASRVIAEGQIAFRPRLAFSDFFVRAAPLRAELIRAFIPEAPVAGAVEGFARLTGAPGEVLDLDSDVTVRDPASGVSRVLATGGVDMRDELSLRNLHVRAAPLRLDLLREAIPELPAGATATGEARLDGAPRGLLRLDGQVAVTEPRTGLSRVQATGAIDTRGELRLHDLLVVVDPLQVDLLRDAVPALPAGATLAGRARLDGVPARELTLDANLALNDPATGLSRVAAVGGVRFRPELLFRDLHLDFDPFQLDLVRGEVPELPAGATVAGPLRLDGAPSGLLHVDGDLALRDPATGLSRVAAVGGVRLRPELLFRDLRLDLAPLQLDLVRAEVPELPPGATLAGPLRLDGPPAGLLQVDGDLTLDDPASGISQVAARGGIDFTEPRFQALDLRFRPLQLAIVQRFEPGFPIGGTLAGTATLDGRPDVAIGFVADLTHREAGELSRVAGRGHIDTAHPDGRFDVDLHLEPLSLRTVGRFVPEAGLRGQVAGTLQTSGTLAGFDLQASLALPDDGALVIDGRFDLASVDPAYSFDARLAGVNLAAVTERAPARTSLTGTVEAHGRGVDPETMSARVDADLVGPRVDDLEVDEVRLSAVIDDGLASFHPAFIRLATAEARVEGSFGLVPDREGVLRYRIAIDSLDAFAAWMPVTDTLVTEPLPDAREAAAEAAARAERAALVEALATGVVRPTVPTDTLAPIEVHRGTLAGRLEAEGTLRGNVERFDAAGTAEVEDLVVDGNFVRWGRARYRVENVGTGAIDADIVAETGAIRIEGFAFDSTAVEVAYSGSRTGRGEATVTAFQDEHTDISAHVAFALALDRNEVVLTETVLRFDDVTWTDVQPATIAWGEDGVEVQTLELVSDDGARVFIDGLLPLDGDADLDVEIDRLQVAHVLTLLQEDVDLAGLLSVRARVQGTAASPVADGEAALTEVVYDGRPMPDAQATFAYADLQLTAEAELIDAGRVVARADATLPADLSLTGDEGPRLLDGPLRVDVEADEIPLELVHLFTDAVEIADGLAAGRFSIRGTTTHPEFQGDLSLVATRVDVLPLGISFERARGAFTLEGDQLVLDSLVAWNDGPVRLQGSVDLSDLTAPGFDLTLGARESWLIDTDDANLLVDADLTIEGPFDSVVIAGDVRIRRGVIYIPELLAAEAHDPVDLEDPETFERVSAALRARRDALISHDPLLDNLSVDVRVRIDRDVWLRSTEANVEVYTPPEVGPISVRMNGLKNGPILVGTVNSDRGEYEFMSRRLDVTRAAVTFSGEEGFNPFVQLVAEHEVRPPGHEPLTIRVLLVGFADDLEIEIESNAEPPIPQTDLLSYFVFGRGAATLLGHQGSTLAGQGASGVGLIGDVTTVAAQQLGGVFLDTVLGGFEAETARALGLDVFRIRTVDVPHEILTGNMEDILRATELEAGAYLTPRIFVAGQIRPTLEHPGLLFEYTRPDGFEWNITLRSRYLTPEPTLEESDPERRTTFGSFVRRIWRF